MSARHSFPYLPVPGTASVMPLLPLRLKSLEVEVKATALLDSGATVNVLPHSLGVQLGLDWTSQSHVLELGGNLARHEARGVLLEAAIEGFPPVRLAFAWSASDNVRLILGQINFFLAFDVTFRRADLAFDLWLR
ncbi:MAG: hypothetical protein ACKV19_19100 [Verrucomicrobiales bacterium]